MTPPVLRPLTQIRVNSPQTAEPQQQPPQSSGEGVTVHHSHKTTYAEISRLYHKMQTPHQQRETESLVGICRQSAKMSHKISGTKF